MSNGRKTKKGNGGNWEGMLENLVGKFLTMNSEKPAQTASTLLQRLDGFHKTVKDKHAPGSKEYQDAFRKAFAFVEDLFGEKNFPEGEKHKSQRLFSELRQDIADELIKLINERGKPENFTIVVADALVGGEFAKRCPSIDIDEIPDLKVKGNPKLTTERNLQNFRDFVAPAEEVEQAEEGAGKAPKREKD